MCLIVGLLKKESQWLDQLELLLSKGPRPSEDAEELSEDLDVSFSSSIISFMFQFKIVAVALICRDIVKCKCSSCF